MSFSSLLSIKDDIFKKTKQLMNPIENHSMGGGGEI